MKESYMMSAKEVATILQVSKGHAYKLIQKMNEELEAISDFVFYRNQNR